MNRRNFLVASAAIPLSLTASRDCSAKEVSWLADVQRPPRGDLSTDRKRAGVLEPLLINGAQKISSLTQWRTQRVRLLKQWQDFLGPMPQRKSGVRWKVLKRDDFDSFTRKLIRYEAEPEGVTNEAYLLEPKTPGHAPKAPGIVALHQTSRQHIHEIAGVAGPKEQHLGPQLCKLGFIVVCPKNFLWHNAATYLQAVEHHRKRHPQTLGMHKMLYDAMQGVDILQTLSTVDHDRIGCVGHSLGAKEVLYLMAFDPRVKAGVFSEGGLTFRSTNWQAPWYLGPGIREKGFRLNHHQLLALAAPRPLLVLAGEKGRGAADGNRSWPLIEAAQPVYRLYGKPVRLGIYNHGRGHSIPPKARQYMQQWLQTYV